MGKFETTKNKNVQLRGDLKMMKENLKKANPAEGSKQKELSETKAEPAEGWKQKELNETKADPAEGSKMEMLTMTKEAD